MRLAALLLLIPACCFGEVELYTLDNGTEKPITGIVDFGSVPAGDAVSVKFRARNTGKTTDSISMLKVAGSGFTIGGAAMWPFVLAPGVNYDFHVKFSTQNFGSYSAVLTVNDRTATLKATALATFVVLQDGAVLPTGSPIEFGMVERGTPVRREITIENRSASAVSIDAVSVSGSAFGFPEPIAPPLVLAVSERRTVVLECAPLKPGLLSETLTVGGRQFTLNALATEPKPPRPVVRIQSTAGIASAQQVRVSIDLESTSRSNMTGRLTLTGLKDDAVVFTTGGKPTLDFEIREGDTKARIGSGTEAIFQTGTAAGTLTVKAELGGYTDQATIVIAPAKVVVDSTRGSWEGTNLVLVVSGYDNTRTLGALAFTFYDAKGNALTATPLRFDAAPDAKRFYDASTAGGVFSLKAAFPVSGAANRIAGAEVELTNSSGVSRTERIRF